jgi:hypothetical protein
MADPDEVIFIPNLGLKKYLPTVLLTIKTLKNYFHSNWVLLR